MLNFKTSIVSKLGNLLVTSHCSDSTLITVFSLGTMFYKRFKEPEKGSEDGKVSAN